MTADDLRKLEWIREIVWIQDPDSDYCSHRRKRYDDEYPCGEIDENGHECTGVDDEDYDPEHVCVDEVWVELEPRQMTRWRVRRRLEVGGVSVEVFGFGQSPEEALDDAITTFAAKRLAQHPCEGHVA